MRKGLNEEVTSVLRSKRKEEFSLENSGRGKVKVS